MITITALSFLMLIFLEDIKYMMILTRQERERLVLELYNQVRLITKYVERQDYLCVI
jgi:hypothetical protein